MQQKKVKLIITFLFSIGMIGLQAQGVHNILRR
jgi:hypothetical protein